MLHRGWRLYLPESWSEDGQRRATAGIPKQMKFRRQWELALELIDQARKWRLAARIMVADAGYGNVTAFRAALEQRNFPYAMGGAIVW
jgi:SRSO17 transposase